MEDFYLQPGTKDGRRCWCKVCVSEYNNRPDVKARCAEHEQKPRTKAVRKAYWNSPQGKANARARANKPENRAKKLARQKSPEGRELARVNRAIQMQNPEFRLCANMRSRMWQGLANDEEKWSSTNELLGCSWDQFMGWLEIQFDEGMCWDNYGSAWHVDHIKPLARFDLSDPAQQRIAFHYKNTQPLWAEDNLSKGAKLL